MSALYEVGDLVKIDIDGKPWAGTIITYNEDSDPISYLLSIEGQELRTVDESDILSKLNNSGGGAGLPEVTADDNGDVLTVVEGAWAKAAPSGGGFPYIVTFTWDDNGGTCFCDKTFDDVSAHIVEGIVLGLDGDNGFSKPAIASSPTTISFEFLYMLDDTLTKAYYQLSDDESVTTEYYGYTLTPDEGEE